MGCEGLVGWTGGLERLRGWVEADRWYERGGREGKDRSALCKRGKGGNGAGGSFGIGSISDLVEWRVGILI